MCKTCTGCHQTVLSIITVQNFSLAEVNVENTGLCKLCPVGESNYISTWQRDSTVSYEMGHWTVTQSIGICFPALMLIRCVTLGKLLHIFLPQLPLYLEQDLFHIVITLRAIRATWSLSAIKNCRLWWVRILELRGTKQALTCSGSCFVYLWGHRQDIPEDKAWDQAGRPSF